MTMLNYKVMGSGRPVIILHGLFGMLDNWQTVAKVLAERYQVWLIDQRDHGKSPHTEAFDYELLAQDLYDFVTEHQIEDPIVIGHSMGGKVAMAYCSQHPHQIAKLIVVDIAPKTYKGGHEEIFKALLDLDLSSIVERDQVYQHLSDRIDEESTRQFLMKNLQRNPEGGYQWKMNINLLYASYQSILDSPSLAEMNFTPTLFVAGARSNYILPEDEPDIHRYFPNAEILFIPDAGHWVHAEKPNELIEAVFAFIES